MPTQNEITTTTRYRKKYELEAIKTVMEWPETVEEAVEMWGADVVLSNCQQNVVVGNQAATRSKLNEWYLDINIGPDEMAENDKGEEVPAYSCTEPEEVVEGMTGWKPSAAKPAKTTVERMTTDFAKMSAAKRAEVLAELQALQEME